MATKLDRAKIIVEIVAIFVGGVFAFVTWGVDYINVNEPRWSLKLEDFGQYKAIEVNGVNHLCPTTGCNAPPTSCVYQATLKTKNEGKKQLDIESTDVSVYFIDRPDIVGVTNASLYELQKSVCEVNENKKGCLNPYTSFSLDAIDSLPVFPKQEGMRPFAIEINPLHFLVPSTVESLAKNKVMLISITQIITPDSLNPWQKSFESKLMSVNQSICNMRDIEAESGNEKQITQQDLKVNG